MRYEDAQRIAALPELKTTSELLKGASVTSRERHGIAHLSSDRGNFTAYLDGSRCEKLFGPAPALMNEELERRCSLAFSRSATGSGFVLSAMMARLEVSNRERTLAEYIDFLGGQGCERLSGAYRWSCKEENNPFRVELVPDQANRNAFRLEVYSIELKTAGRRIFKRDESRRAPHRAEDHGPIRNFLPVP